MPRTLRVGVNNEIYVDDGLSGNPERRLDKALTVATVTNAEFDDLVSATPSATAQAMRARDTMYMAEDGRTVVSPGSGTLQTVLTARPDGSLDTAAAAVRGAVRKSALCNVYAKPIVAPTRAFVVGDSISAVGPYGTGVNNGEMYCSRLAAAYPGLTWVQCGYPDAGINGYWHANLVGASLASDDVVLGLHGFNDLRRVGPGATVLEDIQAAYEGLYSWCGLPEASKVRTVTTAGALNSAVTFSGTWTTWGFAGGKLGAYASTIGASQTFQVTGDTVYVWTMRQNGGTGAASITVDGVDYGSVDSALSYTASGVYNAAYVPVVTRISGLSSGAHTVVVTLTAAATMVVAGAAGFNRATVAGPTVLAGNVLRMTSTGYAIASYAANNPGAVSGTWSASTEPQWMFGDGGVSSYNRRHASAVENLRRDGLSIVLMDVSAQYKPTAMVTADEIHPKANGHALIKSAFAGVLDFLLST